MFTYDLVDLRLFSAAARAGSVSQAASEVHLAVSSASARLNLRGLRHSKLVRA